MIDWLREANQSAVSRQLQLSCHEVDGIMSRAVARGLARREKISPTRIGVNETSFQKRHEYVTVVTNIDNSRVIAVMDGRTEEAFLTISDRLTKRSARRSPSPRSTCGPRTSMR